MKLSKKRQDKLGILLGKVYEEAGCLVSLAGDWNIDIFIEMRSLKSMKKGVRYLSKLITELNSKFYKEDEETIEHTYYKEKQ